MPNAPRAVEKQPVQLQPHDQPPVTFKTVFEEEMQQIAHARQAREVYTVLTDNNQVLWYKKNQ